MYKRYLKIIVDYILLLLSFTVLFIPIFVIAFFVLIINGRPVLFMQQRPGLNGKFFVMYKFRTMNNKRDQNGDLLPDEMRLTKFGVFLRKTSLDELPELLNVLKGEMSFVGPRPLLVEYINLYNNQQRRRHEVKPGITGLAQVNGRNAISWDEKFKFDVYYVDNISFILDLKIIFLTFFKVLKSEGINSSLGKTMDKFNGNI